MTNIKNSKFETYLMDQEVELEEMDEKYEVQQIHFQHELYPEGFFSSL